MTGHPRPVVFSIGLLALVVVLMGSVATPAGAASVGASFEVSGDRVVGLPISFSDRSSGEPKWVYWNFGDGRSSREPDTTHAFMFPGTYEVRYTVCAAVNDCDTTRQEVAIARPAAGETPAAPVARFTTSGTKLAGSPVTFTDRSTGRIAWVYWNFGDGSSSRTKSLVTHTFTEPGTYNVRYSVCVAVDRCDLQIQSVQISAPNGPGSGTPSADFGYSLVTGDAAGTSLQFTDRSAGDVRWVYWNFGDGSSSRERSPSHTYGATGRYQVRYSVCATSVRCDTEVRWIETGVEDGAITPPPTDDPTPGDPDPGDSDPGGGGSAASTILDTASTSILGSIAWSPDGSLLAIVDFDAPTGEILVWNVADLNSPAYRLVADDRPIRLSWSPDSSRLATVDPADSSVRVRSLDDPSNTIVVGQLEGVTRVAWSPDGTRLVTTSKPDYPRPSRASVWDLSRLGSPAVFLPHSQTVRWAKWSGDGSKLMTLDVTGNVWVWSSEDWSEPIGVIKDPATRMYDVEWAPDGSQVVSRDSDHVIRVWDVADPATPIELRGHVNFVRSVEWSPDGLQVVSASRDGTIRIWDPDDPTNPQVVSGHIGSVAVVRWSPDGSMLASGGDDGTIRLWDLDDLDNSRVLRGHTGGVDEVRWSADGSNLVSYSLRDKTARVWSVN